MIGRCSWGVGVVRVLTAGQGCQANVWETRFQLNIIIFTVIIIIIITIVIIIIIIIIIVIIRFAS